MNGIKGLRIGRMEGEMWGLIQIGRTLEIGKRQST
jgi:hypothetical protein